MEDNEISQISILDFPQQIMERIIMNLHLKDRESFALACGALNLVEKATDLCFGIVYDTVIFKLPDPDNFPEFLWKTKDVDAVSAFRRRRLITKIDRLIGLIRYANGMRQLCAFWEGIYVNQLHLCVEIDWEHPEEYELNEILSLLEKRADECGSIEVKTFGAESQIYSSYFDFIRELPALPLTICIGDKTDDPPSCSLIRYAFVEEALHKHRCLTIMVHCPKISAKEHKLLYEAIANLDLGYSLKLMMDLDKATSFLAKLGVTLAKKQNDETRYGFGVDKDLEVQIFAYHFSPTNRAYCCYFYATKVLVKLQPYRTPNGRKQFIVTMEKVDKLKHHWAWVNEQRREPLIPHVVEPVFFEKILSIF